MGICGVLKVFYSIWFFNWLQGRPSCPRWVRFD